jgi:hypothetical protein
MVKTLPLPLGAGKCQSRTSGVQSEADDMALVPPKARPPPSREGQTLTPFSAYLKVLHNFVREEQCRPKTSRRRRRVLVSFAGHGGCKPQSFPRKRESTRQTFGNAPAGWIPAYAGMTGVPKGIPPQMTLPPSGEVEGGRNLPLGCVLWPTQWVQ